MTLTNYTAHEGVSMTSKHRVRLIEQQATRLLEEHGEDVPIEVQDKLHELLTVCHAQDPLKALVDELRDLADYEPSIPKSAAYYHAADRLQEIINAAD